MLVVTLNPGESLLADNEFELFFMGFDGAHLARFHLHVAMDRSYVVAGPERTLTSRHASQFVPEEFSMSVDGYIRVGQTVVHVSPKSRERIKLAVDAPHHIKLTRPAQHGGSLVAR